MSSVLLPIVGARLLQWHLIGVVLVGGVSLIAQTTPPPSAAADLTAPALQSHSRLPRYFRAGGQIKQELAEARASVAQRGIPWKGLSFVVNDAENLGGLTPAITQKIYQKLACQADAIVIGQPRASVPHVSDWGTVYTDYVFAINAVVKDKSETALAQKTVIITRPGGSAVVEGDPVSFSYRGYPALTAENVYLQFLSYIPESHAYQVFDPYSTLVANKGEWIVARQGSAVALPGLPQGVLESTIQQWLLTCK